VGLFSSELLWPLRSRGLKIAVTGRESSAMKNVKTIIVIALVAAAWIGIRFDLRRTVHQSPTDIPLNSSSNVSSGQARPVHEPPAADRLSGVEADRVVPHEPHRGGGEASQARPPAGRRNVTVPGTDQAKRAPARLQPRPVAPVESARSAATIDPDP